MKTFLAGLFLVLIAPTALFAQASITGVVRDSSGAILPGVTVEASSPALIERTRFRKSGSLFISVISCCRTPPSWLYGMLLSPTIVVS